MAPGRHFCIDVENLRLNSFKSRSPRLAKLANGARIMSFPGCQEASDALGRSGSAPRRLRG